MAHQALSTSIPPGIQDATYDASLEACIAARSLVVPEQEKLLPLIAAADSEMEREARRYQSDLIAWQINRAADISEKRLKHLKNVTNWKTEKAKCKASIAYWFEMYAWGFDPRPDAPLAVMPLVPFDFQLGYLEWLNDLVFTRRSSGLAEKSRDMGATVFALGWCDWHWLYTDFFTAILTSATEDLVDSTKDSDTLFEKVRFVLRLLPEALLPKGFNVGRDVPYMNLANPENGSQITGSAPTSRVGRQRRRAVAICDEFPTYPQGGFPQWRALSQTVKSIVLLGTPEGKNNKYADVAHDGVTPKYEMDWRKHPWKDDRWYNSLPYGVLGPAMTPEDIAQEIDRNYDASQPGKVFTQWKEEYCLITQDELIAYYEQFGLGAKFKGENEQFRVPDDWSWGREMDYGQTPAHPWIVSHMARPRENYPLHDSVFVFSVHQILPAAAASPEEGRAQYTEIEASLGLTSDPELSEMSHEQCGEEGLARVLMDEFGDTWWPWSTDYNVGIPQIQTWLTLIDKTQPNPIRPALPGRTRIYFVAPSSEYKLVYDRKNERWFVTPSITERGFKGLREEMPAYHYPPEERGKPVSKMRPKKIKDDRIDTLRGFACRWGPSLKPMTKQERQFSKLPEHLTARALKAALGTPEFPDLYTAQRHQLSLIEKKDHKDEAEMTKEWLKFTGGRPAFHSKYRRR